MTEFRRDPIAGRWVIVNHEEQIDPKEFSMLYPAVQKVNQDKCFFCPGKEWATPKEVYAYRPDGSPADAPGWKVRVVPNKFPALVIEGDIDRRPVGLYDMSNGVGAHEVIIETPDHNQTLADLSFEDMAEVIKAYRARLLDLKHDKRFKYMLIFKNFGLSAGASVEHDHSQIIALPMVPKNVHEELLGAERYFKYRERCIFCDLWQQEKQEAERIVYENSQFITFCPFVSRFPFEMCIMPKEHMSCLAELSDNALTEFAKALKDALKRLQTLLNNPPYNFVIHIAPVQNEYSEEKEYYHWHVEIMPRISRVAGFEWGSGFYILPGSPEESAKMLKQVIW